MAYAAKEVIFNSSTATTPISSYDSTKANLGTLIFQRSSATPPYVGPPKVGLARPMEETTTIAVRAPSVYSWSTTTDWVFLADNAAITTTRRAVLYEWDKVNHAYTWKGFITCTFPPGSGNFTVEGFQAVVSTYSTGNVDVSGTGVTGHSTAWQTARFAAGARIGFGSTDPTQIVTWFNISTITNDTSITLGSSASTVNGSSYVIEEIRLVWAMINSTATNGGLFLTKGLNYSTFASGGTAIGTAASTDNLQKNYWLSDASTTTMTTTGGVIADTESSDHLSQDCYFLNGAVSTSCNIYKFNLRAALSLTSGKDTANAFTLKTGTGVTIGNVAQNNSITIATASHGPGNGIKSLYFNTVSRVYRTPLTSIVAGSTTFAQEAMIEIAPGGSNTFATSGTMSQVAYESTLDRFIISTTGNRCQMWLTQFRTDADKIDAPLSLDTRIQHQTTASGEVTPTLNTLSLIMTMYHKNGWTHCVTSGGAAGATTAQTNFMYAVPTGVDWSAASTTSQRLITPNITLYDASSLYRCYINFSELEGGNTLGQPTETFRVYYRTSGITDNSGSWTLLPVNYDLSGIYARNIQFMVEFRILGFHCVPSQIYSIGVLYNNEITDSHYQPSAVNSSASSKIFAWRFSTAFGGAVPALRVRLYNDVTGDLLGDDNTTTSTGTFEKSTDGGSNWVAWTNADKGNNTTYLRYTPLRLMDGVKVRALLTQL